MRWLALALLALARPALAAEPLPPRILGLDEALRTALASQPQLRQARAGTEAAAARAAEARAPLLPQVAGSASYERTTSNAAPLRSIAALPHGSLDTSASWSFGARLSQLVWDFGQSTGRFAAARASAEAQRQAERAAEIQVLLGVRTAYFAARAAKDLVAVSRENLQNQEAHLRQVEGFVEVGTRPEIDLAQARTDRANAQVQVINAENGYEVAKAQLNLAMGVEGPTSYEVADETLPALDVEEGSTDDLLAEALRERPDVASLRSQLRAQESTVASVEGGYLPSLGLTTGVSDTGPTPGRTYWNWDAGATLTWNLFQGGLTRAQAQEARANLDGLGAQEAALRQQIRLEVEQSRLAVRAARAALAAAGEALTNARERLRLAEGRYQTGAGSAIELGDAQVAITSAGAQRVQAQYSLSSARAQLLKALGRS